MRRTTRASGRCLAALAGLLLAATGMVPLAWAAPAPTCGDVDHQNQCGSAQICICCHDADCINPTYGDFHGNCVWWTWEKACRDWGEALSTCHNADTWNENNQATHHISTEPCVDTIFVCEQYTTFCGATNWGHVGWVLEVYPNGSIRVSEQGCCWFRGVRERTFDAHLASPTMDYIYQQGLNSCSQCDCNPNDTEQRSCADGCGVEERTCAGDCTWGAWTGCDAVPECEPGEYRSCGECGAQICLLDCMWSACDERCDADAGAPGPDSGTSDSDAGAGAPDGGGPDGAMNAGCSCRSGAGGGTGAALALMLAVLLVLGVWRRRRGSSPGRPDRRAARLPGVVVALLALAGLVVGVGCGDSTQTQPDATLGDSGTPIPDARTGDGGITNVPMTLIFTEAEEVVVVPEGAQFMHVKLWGGGGNDESQCDWALGDGLDGGQGGFTEAIFEVRPGTALEPGTALVVIVGSAGLASTAVSRFGFGVRGGGGLTGVFFGPGPIESGDATRALAIAGGGGSASGPDCHAGGPGNHPDAGGRDDMQGGEGTPTTPSVGGGAGYSGGAGGDSRDAADGGEGFVDQELENTLDSRVNYASLGDYPVPGSNDEDYVAHGGSAGLSEHAGLAVINFVWYAP
jgi:MYXO-CTERM domain-containing protein